MFPNSGLVLYKFPVFLLYLRGKLCVSLGVEDESVAPEIYPLLVCKMNVARKRIPIASLSLL